MQLRSHAFQHQGKIPVRFTCDGADVSPPLVWSGAPKEARSFALVCSDPDAPNGTWYHWAMFDISKGVSELVEHRAAGSSSPPQAINDFRKRGYSGPCPPRGHGQHHYHFTLFAVNVTKLDVLSAADCREVEAAARSHAIATAELVGTYER